MTSTHETSSRAFRNSLIEQLPGLRAFARSLVQNRSAADDLVQETVLKALKNEAKFKEGTNLRAWLFTILRNQYYTTLRKTRREVEDIEGRHAAMLSVRPEQTGAIELQAFQTAFAQLPPDQREALTLIGASELSYEEAAEICGCAVGTIKSRVSRARKRLATLMDINIATDLSPVNVFEQPAKDPLMPA
ncbi:MAG: sigma-70 family RNA polymerase sigma factor [Asticcacaulis sp.]